MDEVKTRIRECVKRGVKLLNDKVPDWYKNINVEELKMYNCFDCVLGQLYENFNKGRTELFGNVSYGGGNYKKKLSDTPHLYPREVKLFDDIPTVYGFNLCGFGIEDMDEDEYEETWDFLRGLWVEEARKRLYK